jgi:hypothetical protein
MSRFDTPESIERKKALANRPSWRIDPATRGYDPDSVFKLISKASKQNNNNTRGSFRSSGNVRQASMLPGEWIPGLCIAWGPDSNDKAILEHNRKITADYYNQMRRRGYHRNE